MHPACAALHPDYLPSKVNTEMGAVWNALSEEEQKPYEVFCLRLSAAAVPLCPTRAHAVVLLRRRWLTKTGSAHRSCARMCALHACGCLPFLCMRCMLTGAPVLVAMLAPGSFQAPQALLVS